MLMATEGILNEKSDLRKYGSDSTVIRGIVQYAKKEVDDVQQPGYQSPAPSMSRTPKSVKSTSAKPDGHKRKKSQISTVAVFGNEKKRVILKMNPKKGVNEYTMDILREKVLKKYKQKGLKGHFSVKMASGQAIQQDQDIENHLVGYGGEIKIEQLK